MSIEMTTLTLEDIERRRAEIEEIISQPDFKERQEEGVLLSREQRLLDELEDLNFLRYGHVETD
ncbi:hypothetical protein ACSL103130_06510 [Actinomyces slackii]|uniref:Uncharacterized protein n=1 Tax=Actinomyces slackii TaxID=52774 RepID=A0A3S4SRB4_9ACTO|nr:hypothetical protein [Actinomyces slackii]VEG75896.1 Uncharacterised protein [Actinomyces slackii]